MLWMNERVTEGINNKFRQNTFNLKVVAMQWLVSLLRKINILIPNYMGT